MSPIEHERFLARRSTRFHSAWAWPILVMALIALPIHALGLEKEPMGQRYFVVVWPDWLCSIFCSDDALLEIRASQRNIPATMSDNAVLNSLVSNKQYEVGPYNTSSNLVSCCCDYILNLVPE